LNARVSTVSYARPVLAAAAVLALPAAGLVSVWLGQDANWDLRNYHFYNAYAFLHGRMGFDMAVAHHATFYNPLSDLPFYWLVTNLGPRATGFAVGAIQGLNFALVLAIAWQALAPAGAASRLFLSLASAGLGMAGAIGISELGTTFHDNLISLFSLSALWILVARRGVLAAGSFILALATAAGAGLLAGLGVGLKQPAVIFAMALCAALFFVPVDFRRRFLLSFVFGLGVLMGIAAGGGFWIWKMWRDFANPLFPYYNQFFQSPWAIPADYVNRGFLPRNWIEALFYPFVFAARPDLVSEAPFFDLRLPLLYALGVAALASWCWRRFRQSPPSAAARPADGGAAALLLAMALIAYLVWIKLFGVYRYLLPLEMLAPLLLILLVGSLGLPRRVGLVVLAALALVLAASTRPANWGRIAWGVEYFGVDVPAMAEPKRGMAILSGAEPLGYVVPFFPPEIPFLRIEGWFIGPTAPPNRYVETMRRRISGHDGPLYVLFREPFETQRAIDALAAFRLQIRRPGCVTMKTHMDKVVAGEVAAETRLSFCPLDRR
jgi:hypothetical protein